MNETELEMNQDEADQRRGAATLGGVGLVRFPVPHHRLSLGDRTKGKLGVVPWKIEARPQETHVRAC